MVDGKPSGAESEGGRGEVVGLREPKGRPQLSVHETDYDLGEDCVEEARDDRVVKSTMP